MPAVGSAVRWRKRMQQSIRKSRYLVHRERNGGQPRGHCCIEVEGVVEAQRSGGSSPYRAAENGLNQTIVNMTGAI